MKNITIKIFVCLMFLAMFGVNNFAQTSKRIDFAKEGSNSLVWEEKVAAGKSKSYVFYAKKGQTLSLGMIDDTDQGQMDLGKISIEPNTDPFEMEIEVTKDYTLSVTNNSNISTSFRIFISLEDAKKSSSPKTSDKKVDMSLPNTERVKFPKGSIEVNLEKSVMANNAKRFVFWAKAGQEIAFTVTPNRKNANLSIDFDGKEVAVGESFSVIAPQTGDYMIQILNAGNANQSFTLDLGIAEPPTSDDSDDSSDSSMDNGNAVRVTIPKGDNNANITKEISANGSIDFLINVKKGQELGFEVGYDFKDGDIEAFLTEPEMQDISASSGPKTRKVFKVNKSGDHRLTVNNTTRKKVTITLYVDVY